MVSRIHFRVYARVERVKYSWKLEPATPVRKDSKTFSSHCVPDATL